MKDDIVKVPQAEQAVEDKTTSKETKPVISQAVDITKKPIKQDIVKKNNNEVSQQAVKNSSSTSNLPGSAIVIASAFCLGLVALTIYMQLS